ncbi:MAG: hypothetical protein JNL70_20725 [Saprospiraceae bacterium]|nr:hypothetical protein [Saprospiraceae bacterium]
MSDEKKPKKTGKKKTEIGKFDMGINEFGELTTTINLDKINDFLNQNVSDKKLVEKEETEKAKKKKK